MPNLDKLFEDVKESFDSGQFRVFIQARSRKEAQKIRAGLYYRAIRNLRWWHFNIIGETDIMISKAGKI